MKPARAGALISATKQLTKITDHALARKLAIAVSELRACEQQGAPLPEAASRILEEFHALATQKSGQLSAPRVPAPTVETGAFCGDSTALLQQLPDACIDAIVSDIPYGIGLDVWDVLHKNTNTALLGQSAAQKAAGRVFDKRRKPINGWSSSDRAIPRAYYEWCQSWASEWLRVLKPGASALVFAGRRLAPRCVTALEDEGFNFRDMLAWLRPRAVFRAQRLSRVLEKRGELAEAQRWQGWRVGNLAPVFEPIIWCFKPYAHTLADNVLDHGVGAMQGERYAARVGSYDNVIHAGLAVGEGGLHAAQKPVSLIETLIELCTPAQGIVLDPFAGSGSTAIAAIRTGRRYIVMERDSSYYQIMQQRIAEAG